MQNLPVPTHEQQHLIDLVNNKIARAAPSSRGIVIRAVAYAGASKTTSLLMVANELLKTAPHLRLLYLAYNKSVQLEAKKIFPSNVRAITTHGAAYSTFGTKYAAKLGNIRVWDAATALSARTGYGVSAPVARIALETMTAWLCSADAEISAKHVPLELISSSEGNIPQIAAALAKVLWQCACNLDDATKMPHDGYLKLYALSSPRLPYPIVLFDEAQDANPVTRQIVMSQHQQGSNVIMVGDPNQQIYTFRGAENALNAVEADYSINLTQSFRFGHGIANLASTLLRETKGESHHIKGLGEHKKTLWKINTQEPHTVLARTNAGLFAEAIGYAMANRPIHFVGGHGYHGQDNYKLRLIEDAFYLSTDQTNKIRTPQIAAMGHWDRLVELAEAGGDKELTMIRRVVDDYGQKIPELIAQLVGAHTEDPAASVVLTTAHRSKGLQWDQVRLSDDFPSLYDDKGKLLPAEELGDEAHLLYVALTRARKAIVLNGSLREILDKSEISLADCNNPEMLNTPRFASHSHH